MAEYIDREENYHLGSGNLQLKAIMGDGQLGSLTVYLGYDKVGSNEEFSGETNLTIGSVDACKGKTVTVVATITDIQSNTNWTSLTLDLLDEENSQEFPYREEVENNAGTITYTIKIHIN